ncbi:MAG: TonB-dependent receptor [Marinifilaceae bacterium]|jgi:iron complex outermembrane receptor protein|nr:TonB-dependent receptor [Marinifilaceae bacterium]
MKHIAFIFILFFICSKITFPQGKSTLKGIVTDTYNKPIAGANIILNNGEYACISKNTGVFEFQQLTHNNYVIQISFIGYKTIKDTISLDKNFNYVAKLSVDTKSLNEVKISVKPTNARKIESRSIEIIDKTKIKENLGGTLMNSLENIPGISTINIGSGQSKPVIRGLGFNRISVVENNIKHEAQQWGADHGLEIDQYSVEYVKIVKGPASLEYGSDAIGGIIDINTKKIPLNNSIGGNIDLIYKSNNNLYGSSTAIFARKEKIYGKIRATYIDYGDYKVPTDSIEIYSYKASLDDKHLRNTAGWEKNIHTNIGYMTSNFNSNIIISNIHTKSGFFANAHGLEPRNIDTKFHDKSNRDINFPFQEVNHFKIINSNSYDLRKINLRLNIAFQRNKREEWSEYVNHGYMPSKLPNNLNFNPDLERKFIKDIYSANFTFTKNISEKTNFKIGLNSEIFDNKINGRGFIIPNFTRNNIGSFAILKQKLNKKSNINAGVRYDYGEIRTEKYFDWFNSPTIYDNKTEYTKLQRAKDLNKSFSNLSWSIGYTMITGKFNFKTNIGKSFRIPTAKELSVNGVNYHNFSYEIGDENLSPEISYQWDISSELNINSKVNITNSLFLNYFSNYIYLNPTSKHDRLYGNGNQVFRYQECELLRYGGELFINYKLNKEFESTISSEYIYSEQLSGSKKGFTVPFSPPTKLIFELKYKNQKLGFFNNFYMKSQFIYSAKQNRIVPPEKKTNSYQNMNFASGGNIKISRSELNISFQIQNLFNKKYFNHTDYYRLINIPASGRNFIINISIPFSSKFNNI